MRKQVDDELESVISKCNNMEQLRAVAMKKPAIVDAVSNSMSSVNILICNTNHYLTHKGKMFKVFLQQLVCGKLKMCVTVSTPLIVCIRLEIGITKDYCRHTLRFAISLTIAANKDTIQSELKSVTVPVVTFANHHNCCRKSFRRFITLQAQFLWLMGITSRSRILTRQQLPKCTIWH